jgi:uncharacterized protein (DUF362 family)
LCSKKEALASLPSIAKIAGYDASPVHTMLVKPNVCGMYHPELRLLRAIVEFLMPSCGEIVIGETDSTMHTPGEMFERLGITRLASELGLSTKDLSRDPVRVVEVPSPHVLRSLSLPKTVLDCDRLINVPGVGRHSEAFLTCALKNLFGLIPERQKYSRLHPLGISEVLADLNQVIRPSLTVVDWGSKVVVGVDPVAVDVVVARGVGMNPRDVKHLRLTAQDRGLDLDHYEVDLREV